MFRSTDRLAVSRIAKKSGKRSTKVGKNTREKSWGKKSKKSRENSREISREKIRGKNDDAGKIFEKKSQQRVEN